MNRILRGLRCLWKAETFSAPAFISRAAILSLLYLASRIADLQEHTAFLSGTPADPNLSWETSAMLGLIHLLLHVSFLLLVPISLITAGLLVLWERFGGAAGRSFNRTTE